MGRIVKACEVYNALSEAPPLQAGPALCIKCGEDADPDGTYCPNCAEGWVQKDPP